MTLPRGQGFAMTAGIKRTRTEIKGGEGSREEDELLAHCTVSGGTGSFFWYKNPAENNERRFTQAERRELNCPTEISTFIQGEQMIGETKEGPRARRFFEKRGNYAIANGNKLPEKKGKTPQKTKEFIGVKVHHLAAKGTSRGKKGINVNGSWGKDLTKRGVNLRWERLRDKDISPCRYKKGKTLEGKKGKFYTEEEKTHQMDCWRWKGIKTKDHKGLGHTPQL